ncbi:MAG: dienelactone hydrolase family protein [Pyrinomonadaceae bacterium]
MKTETMQFETANGATTAFIAAPDNAAAETPIVILIQEYWGLNDHIKDIAGRYANEGFRAVAPDLYRGKLAGNPQEAGQFMQALKIEDGVDTIKNAVENVRETYGATKFGITGYCMGGTYALRAACDLPYFHAAAPFYGDIPPEEILQKLKTPVVFFAGTKDKWINPEKVAQLSEIAEKYNLPVDTISYAADHAFFNDTRPEVYDKDAANDAWAKVIQIFNDNL